MTAPFFILCHAFIAAAVGPDALSPELLLERAQSAADALEYQRVVPLAQELVSREGVAIELRLDGYLLLGSALAVMGDTVGAEKAFRFLLRAQPEFDLPPRTSPKILGLFRKVQFEQQTIRAQLEQLERQRLIAQMELLGDAPDSARGGDSLPFAFRLRDPRGAVAAVNVHYRRADEKNFSTLALSADETGTWSGELPPAWTASDSGFNLEFFVSSLDSKGQPLVTRGRAEQPLAVEVSAGQARDGEPFYRTTWFWSVVGATAVAVGGVSWWAYREASSLPDSPLGTHEIE